MALIEGPREGVFHALHWMTVVVLAHGRGVHACVQRQWGVESKERIKVTVLILDAVAAMSVEAQGIDIIAMIFRAVRLFTVGLFTMVCFAMILVTVSIVTIIILAMSR